MIAIIDCGISNLLSIKRAVELFDSNVVITYNEHIVENADKIILPGVGAFEHGMKQLQERGMLEVINKQVSDGKPILGICLGMQMLFESSEEGGLFNGLGLIPGVVKKIPYVNIDGEVQNVPHIGWEKLEINESQRDDILLSGLDLQQEVYFVHSFEAHVTQSKNLVATALYGGRNICAIARKDNVVGCQFHPEKSGQVGLQILENYIKKFV